MSLPYDYYPAVLYALNLLSQGETLTVACDKSNITVEVFDYHVKGNTQLEGMYAEAVQRGNDAMADALINIDNHKIHGQSDPKMAKVISDNIKWVLSKRDNKRFGDKVEVRHEVTMDKAIVNALEQARKRTRALEYKEDATLIDVTPSTKTDDELMDELLS